MRNVEYLHSKLDSIAYKLGLYSSIINSGISLESEVY